MIRGRAPHWGKGTRAFPDNADGDALFQVATQGSDLTKPMDIDFVVLFGDQSEGREIAKAAKAAGYASQVATDDDGDWICYCTKTMVPSYEAIVAAKAELGALVAPLGGQVDGWETAGNGSGEPFSIVDNNPNFVQFGGRGGW